MQEVVFMDDFLDELSDCCKFTKIAIDSATALLKCSTVPPEVRLDIRNKIAGCESIIRKYEAIIGSTVFDEQHRRNITLATRLYDLHMSIVLGFMNQINDHLMNYGDGPSFLKPIIRYPQPLEV